MRRLGGRGSIERAPPVKDVRRLTWRWRESWSFARRVNRLLAGFPDAGVHALASCEERSMGHAKRTAWLAGASLVTAFAMAGLSSPWTVTTAAAPAGEESGERVVEDGGSGPYKAIMVGDSSLPTHTIFRPKDLSAFGGRVTLPILAWGNGGCANSPAAHQNYLSEIASHGFLIVAIGPLPAPGGGRGAAAGAPSGGTFMDAI